VGGLEGRPPAVQSGGALRRSTGGGSSTQSEDYGNGQFNCNNSRTGIGMISEGGENGAVFVDGKMIMTPN
jgi:hypothetical protein